MNGCLKTSSQILHEGADWEDLRKNITYAHIFLVLRTEREMGKREDLPIPMMMSLYPAEMNFYFMPLVS